MSRFWLSERWHVVASAMWLMVLLAAPVVHCWPAAFCATVLLIVGNAAVSFRALTRRREVLLGLNCVQIVLFGVLSYQLYRTFGCEHYRCDREPCFYDWIEFTIAHVLRAADLLDTLDEYGIPLQSIMHNSKSSGLVLVGMHLTVDGFLIGLVLRWARQYWKDAVPENRLARSRREYGWLLATLGLYAGFVVFARLRPGDWVLWPLDNLLRLLDVGDLFQIFGWKLHGVDDGGLTRTGSVLFRLAAGVWIARLVNWLRLSLLRTWGVSIEELIELLDDPDAQVRCNAAAGLGWTGPAAGKAAPVLRAALHDVNSEVRCEAARALGRLGPPARIAVPDLLDAVWLGHPALRLAAIEALGSIGPIARSAADSLLLLLKVEDRRTRETVAAALAKIAPELVRVLPPVTKVKRRRRVTWSGRRS